MVVVPPCAEDKVSEYPNAPNLRCASASEVESLCCTGCRFWQFSGFEIPEYFVQPVLL